MNGGFSDYVEFWNYVKDDPQTGEDCHGHQELYVPYAKLKQYWVRSRIGRVLKTLSKPFHYSIDQIQERYLIPLSIIVFMSTNRASYLEELETFLKFEIDDYSLPLTKQGDKINDEIWPIFDKAQWKFCPLELGFGRCFHKELDPRCIFPGVQGPPQQTEYLTRVQGANHGADQAALKPMTLGHFAARSLKNLSGNTVVIKSYPAQALASYNSEADAYNSFHNSLRPCNHILRCYGTFQYPAPQNGAPVYNLVLEFADRGSLQDLFMSTPPPKTTAEVNSFWLSLTRFLIGLEKLHTESDNFGGVSVHQDLKPSNILIASNGNDPYNFTPKLCDFGLSNTKVSSHSAATSLGPYNDGTCTFSPPEVHLSGEVEYKATPSMDMWAAACIIIDVAVWVNGGTLGRGSFAQNRRDEIEMNVPRLASVGRADCFHDGNEPLRCVTSLVPLQEPLSSSIVEFTLEEILNKRPEKRLSAGPFVAVLEKKINSATSNNRNESESPPGTAIGPIGRTGRQRATSHNSVPINHAQHPPPLNSNFTSLSSRADPRQRLSGSPITPPQASYPHYITTSPGTMTPPNTNTRWTTGGVVTPFSRQSTVNDGSPEAVSWLQPEPQSQAPEVISTHPIHQQDHLGIQPLSPFRNSRDSSRRPSVGPSAECSDLPFISFEDVFTWKYKKKLSRNARLEGKDVAFPQLRKRDHIFILDNSRTMQFHKKEVIDYFTTLAYLLKEADDDGVEVMLTSDSNLVRSNNTTSLEHHVTGGFYKGAATGCNMEFCLNKLFDQIIEKLPDRTKTSRKPSFLKPKEKQPVSIYILTNGRWTSDYKDAHIAIEEPIWKLVDAIRTRSLIRTQVVLQFIRFGNSPTDIKLLDHLDNFLPPQDDIVDHKSAAQDGVWNVLIGSIDIRNDRTPSRDA